MDTPVAGPAPVIASVQHALADLGAVRTGISQGSVSDREVIDTLELLLALQRQVNGTVSVAMATAEARNAAIRALGTPLEAVLTRSGQESARQVRNQVFQAGILALQPKVHDAAATGRITLGQARAIREVIDGLPGTLDPAQKQRAETILLNAADRLPADVLRSMSDAVLDQVAPDAKDTPQQRQAKLDSRDARARQRRSLRFGVPVDGSVDIHGSLPVLEGTRLKNLLETIAARDYRAAKDLADRARLAVTPDQRLADALLTVIDATGRASHSAEGGSDARPGRGIPPAAAQVTVLMRESDLRDRAHAAGILPDGTPIAAGELRRWLCDAEILPVVFGGASEILDLGRGRRPHNGMPSLSETGTAHSPAAPPRSTAASSTTSAPGKTADPPTSTTSSPCVSHTTSSANPHHRSPTRTGTPEHPTNGPSEPAQAAALSSYHPRR